ncbi:unnamed protein product [Trichogramma brassicae]|uniref:CCHC-type domain-containing protein n=1 Tax=Trichogramma brassicae TaxID=86971 RepID=A0A6H5IT59_9HYME|nr:unnamed protein product [Trichogramma brassicae]
MYRRLKSQDRYAVPPLLSNVETVKPHHPEAGDSGKRTLECAAPRRMTEEGQAAASGSSAPAITIEPSCTSEGTDNGPENVPMPLGHTPTDTKDEHAGTKAQPKTSPAEPSTSTKFPPVQSGTLQPRHAARDPHWSPIEAIDLDAKMDWAEDIPAEETPATSTRQLDKAEGRAIAGGTGRPRGYNPRWQLQASDYVSAIMPSPSSSPEHFGPQQLLSPRGTAGRDTVQSSAGQPARVRNEDGSVIRLSGVKFGGLDPIRTDWTVDPPDYACFNCRLEGHNALQCPAPPTRSIHRGLPSLWASLRTPKGPVNLVEPGKHQRDLARTDFLQADDPGSSEELEYRLAGGVMPASSRHPLHHEVHLTLVPVSPAPLLTLAEFRHQTDPAAAPSSWRPHGPVSGLPTPTSADAEAVRLAMTLIEGTSTLSADAREAVFRSIYGVNPQPR